MRRSLGRERHHPPTRSAPSTAAFFTPEHRAGAARRSPPRGHHPLATTWSPPPVEAPSWTRSLSQRAQADHEGGPTVATIEQRIKTINEERARVWHRAKEILDGA